MNIIEIKIEEALKLMNNYQMMDNLTTRELENVKDALKEIVIATKQLTIKKIVTEVNA